MCFWNFIVVYLILSKINQSFVQKSGKYYVLFYQVPENHFYAHFHDSFKFVIEQKSLKENENVMETFSSDQKNPTETSGINNKDKNLGEFNTQST